MSFFSNKKLSLTNPQGLLSLEGLAWFVASLYFYYTLHSSWWLFASLFFAPDVALAGYLLGPRFGAAFYNALHTEVGPLFMLLCSFLFGVPFLLKAATIWFCHINFDRMLGFGLKYPGGFKQTHL